MHEHVPLMRTVLWDGPCCNRLGRFDVIQFVIDCSVCVECCVSLVGLGSTFCAFGPWGVGHGGGVWP
jgi:hypothetical protein